MTTATEQIRAADDARQFPTNTCPASRHAQQMAEAMVKGEPYPMMEEERSHCGESILSVVTSLYKARTERDALAQRLEAAEKRNSAYATLQKSIDERLVIANKKINEGREAVESLASERAANAKLTSELEAAEKDADRQQDLLDKIGDWCKAYPLDVFPEPDFKRAHEVLSGAGMTLDAISASNMRHVVTQIAKMIDAADSKTGGA